MTWLPRVSGAPSPYEGNKTMRTKPKAVVLDVIETLFAIDPLD